MQQESERTNTFGSRLKEIREEAGLLQSELAENLNIAKSTLGMYETNKREPDFSFLEKVSLMFNVSIDYLVGGTGEISKPSQSSIGELLRKLRGDDSLRVASQKTGLSHSYIALIERGVDTRGFPCAPSPETLKAYAAGYVFPYEELMRVAGYTTDTVPVILDIQPSLYELMKSIEKLSSTQRELISSIVNEFLRDK